MVFGKLPLSLWRTSRPKARARKEMGKCTAAGWIGLLGGGVSIVYWCGAVEMSCTYPIVTVY